MKYQRRPWPEELAIIDNVMKTVSDIKDPEEMVRLYWDGIGGLVPGDHYLALSRRGVEPPTYLITRSSRFKEHFNPWTQRDRLPRMAGGLLGEIAYADKPMIINDLPARLTADDPGRFYLEGFQSLIALPQYEGGKAVNIGMTLFDPGDEFDHSMVPMMHWQASLFGRGTQNLVLRNQLESALASLDRELQVVGEIQRSLLPRDLPPMPGFDLAAYYQTSARAGGDYYDFFPLADGAWGVFIADVSGHGTPAAVLMAITHAIAHSRPGFPCPPHQLLLHLNSHLTRSYTNAGSFVTAFYASINPATKRMVYASAGHNPPLLRRGDRVIPLDQGGGLPLGIVEGEAFGEGEIQLQPGDILLLYTDGLSEAMAPMDAKGSRDLFGVERMEQVLLASGDASAAECIRRVCGEVEAFVAGTLPTDDQTMIAIKCLA